MTNHMGKPILNVSRDADPGIGAGHPSRAGAVTPAERPKTMENQFGDLDVWSDVYKMVHGIRPRFNPGWTSQADYLADMDALQAHSDEDEAAFAKVEADTRAAASTPAPRATLADLWPA